MKPRLHTLSVELIEILPAETDMPPNLLSSCLVPISNISVFESIMKSYGLGTST